MPTLLIRDADFTDIPTIQYIAREAWLPTYGDILSAEQSRFMLDWMYNSETLSAGMSAKTHFLIGNEDTRSVGFAAFEHKEGGVVKLHKIYLLPDFQGKGYGRQLLDEVTRQAASGGGQYLELNVNRQNTARDFYEKLGFYFLRDEDNYIGNGYWMNDYVLRKVL